MSGVCVAICVFTSDPGDAGMFVLGFVSIAELWAGKCTTGVRLAGVLRLFGECLCLGGGFGGSSVSSLSYNNSFNLP